MESHLKKETIPIQGMSCVNCQKKIQNKLQDTEGIIKADVSFKDSSAHITYDSNVIYRKKIIKIIEKMDYQVLSKEQVNNSEHKNKAGILIIILAGYMLLKRLGIFGVFNIFPTAETGMSYGMPFVIGLLTSVHCVAMCGGINLSQCIPQRNMGEGNRFSAKVWCSF